MTIEPQIRYLKHPDGFAVAKLLGFNIHLSSEELTVISKGSNVEARALNEFEHLASAAISAAAEHILSANKTMDLSRDRVASVAERSARDDEKNKEKGC